MLNEDIEKIIKLMGFSNGKYDKKTIFKDLILLETYLINSILIGLDEYADKFNKIMKEYTFEEQTELMNILITLTEIYNKQTTTVDIIGQIHGNLKLDNRDIGQVFTPTYTSDMMTQIIAGYGDIEKSIKELGYVVVEDSACGAGGLILSYAREVKKQGYDTSKYLFAKACDIDCLSTYMTFVQLSLYDIPAIVVNGDSTGDKFNFVLFTPQYYINNWKEKLKEAINKQLNKNEVEYERRKVKNNKINELNKEGES